MIYLLSVLQFLLGFCVLANLNVKFSVYQRITLAMLLGMGLSSIVILLLTFLGISISQTSILVSVLTFLLIPIFTFFFRKKKIAGLISRSDLSIHIYELPFLIAIGYYLMVSIWKCYYFPNIPFDTIVGFDLISKATILEGTLDNSIYNDFLVNIDSTLISNQPYYAPYTLLIQIIYMSFGSLFGKAWLSVMVVSFWLFFYFEMRHYIHPLLAGILCLIAFLSPEMFAYTYLIQTDYSNAIFFVIAVTMFQRYFREGNLHYFILSSLFFGLACWTRTETIFFVPLIGLFMSYKDDFKKGIIYTIAFALLGVFGIVLWNYVFIGGVVPKAIELGQFNFDFSNYFSRLFKTMDSMNSFIFNADYWGYSVTIPLVLIVVNLVIMRKRIEL